MSGEARQAHHEPSPALRPVFGMNASTVVGHDSATDCQSYSHPFVLRRIEGIEKLWRGIDGDAAAGIAYRDSRIAPFNGQTQTELPLRCRLIRHGLDRVDDQVDEYLLQRRPFRHHAHVVIGNVEQHLDAIAPDVVVEPSQCVDQ